MSLKPLDGVKVLAFEIQVAGPYCTMMLAHQGASVIKVERPEGGDTARAGAPQITNDRGETQSGYFLRFNRNKRSVTLNLKSDKGRRLFAELAEKSDVVVENFRPGLLDEMGIGYKGLSERNPGLIYACISGFGSLDGFLGPYSKRPALPFGERVGEKGLSPRSVGQKGRERGVNSPSPLQGRGSGRGA